MTRRERTQKLKLAEKYLREITKGYRDFQLSITNKRDRIDLIFYCVTEGGKQ